MSEIRPIDQATRMLGGQACLAELIGVTAQAVSKWRRTRVPAERCQAIESATGGVVTRYELRPDVFGPAPDSTQRVAEG